MILCKYVPEVTLSLDPLNGRSFGALGKGRRKDTLYTYL